LLGETAERQGWRRRRPLLLVAMTGLAYWWAQRSQVGCSCRSRRSLRRCRHRLGASQPDAAIAWSFACGRGGAAAGAEQWPARGRGGGGGVADATDEGRRRRAGRSGEGPSTVAFGSVVWMMAGGVDKFG
jgi:hypothetical protein